MYGSCVSGSAVKRFYAPKVSWILWQCNGQTESKGHEFAINKLVVSGLIPPADFRPNTLSYSSGLPIKRGRFRKGIIQVADLRKAYV